MRRRIYLKCMLAAGAGATMGRAAANPILLHVDLAVDPSKEKQMLRHFETVFRPAAIKFPGYIDVKLLRLRSALMGSAPSGANYRFALTYQSEEARQKWVASDIHQRVWPPMEDCLTTKDYTVLLFDVAS